MSPSPAARRFRLALLRSGIQSKKEIRANLKDWLGSNWRYLPPFLSGTRRDFPDPNQLTRFFFEKYNIEYSVLKFTNPRDVPPYLSTFCSKRPSSALLPAIEGNYICMRPGTDDLAEPVNDVDVGPDVHELEIASHGASEPGTFRFWTTKKIKESPAEEARARNAKVKTKTVSGGEWNGYVIANPPFAYFFGLCIEAEDASFFTLRQLPDSNLSSDILIGVQTLLLPHPDLHSPRHAVSRPIVAFRSEFATNREVIQTAKNWLEKSRQSFPKARGLLFQIETNRAIKT